MKAYNALEPLESLASEEAARFCIGADSAREISEDSYELFQTARLWTKPFADRPTPDDWPIDD